MRIDPTDNVEVNVENGHKYAITDIPKGTPVIKYGNPIGYATCDIAAGEHVHSHNLATALCGALSYTYEPEARECVKVATPPTFMGYRRKDGGVGIRNEVWVIPTVGCVNKSAEKIAAATGAHAYVHPYGCSQLGDDQATTLKILAGLIKHPNAAGVLVLGLGCENCGIELLKKQLGTYDGERVRFIVAQECENEIEEGIAAVRELTEYAAHLKREPISVSELCIGLKCGGSDGYSGITANVLVGRVCDRITAMGGAAVLTEVPEMFGAEHLLMRRCVSREVFDKTVQLINGFKEYYEKNGQVIYENPSPGNKAGGITTLEEKSLGCVQKGGTSPVTDVLDYGDTVTRGGLSLLNGPGNDMVAVTNLTAAGAHLILFTTGRGTPLGAPVPTLKISTNAALAERKRAWIDFDSSPLLHGADITDELLSLILAVAEGKEAKNEINGYREIAIFKQGVTL